MITTTPSRAGDDTVPSTVEDLCLRHDTTCHRVHATAQAIDSDLTSSLSRDDRLELAAAIGDVAADLSGLLQEKLASGFFAGFEETPRWGERLSHLQSDYRRLMGELRRIQNEIACGKPSKARRQLATWANQFNDVLDNETEFVDELWSFDAVIAA